MRPSRKQVLAAAEVFAAQRFGKMPELTVQQVLPKRAASGWVLTLHSVEVGVTLHFEVIQVPAHHFGFVHKGISFTRCDGEGEE